MSTTTEIREGDLFRFPEGYGWCRHGLLLAHTDHKGSVVLCDTYWGGFSDSTRVWIPSEVEGKIQFIINLNDCRVSNRREYERFAESDRAWVPAGGGGERYYVRKSAAPVADLIIKQLESELDDARRKSEWAANELRRAQQALDEFLSIIGYVEPEVKR